MRALSPDRYPQALAAYAAQPRRFPLIGAVLEGRQGGLALADDPASPSVYFVRDRFGFAFAWAVGGREYDRAALLAAVLDAGAAGPGKLRWYAPDAGLCALLDARAEANTGIRRAERLGLSWPGATPEFRPLPDGCAVSPLEAADLDELEPVLGCGGRFWDSREDFLAGAMGLRAACAHSPARVASVCYAAAVAGPDHHLAEIDVYTREDMRGLGLARAACAAFAAGCLERGVLPHWDCYANNEPSLRLALSLGFVPGEPYPFYNVTLPAGGCAA